MAGAKETHKIVLVR